MKLIYTNENRFIVNNIKNIIQNANIEIYLKNEFIGGAAGDLSPFDTWLELWVVNDKDYDQSMILINALEKNDHAFDWICPQCHEENPATFDTCWQCQAERK